VVIAAVALGIWAGLFMMGFSLGMSNQRVRDVVDFEVGHLQIHHPEFNTDHDINYLIPEAGRLLTDLQADGRVQSYVPRIISMGMAASSSSSGPVMIMGIDPALENHHDSLEHYLDEGEYFPDWKTRPALVSRKMADKLNLKIRSRLVLSFQDTEGNIGRALFRVAGVYKTNNAQFDAMRVFVRQEDIAPVLGVGSGIHEISVKLKDGDDLKKVAAEYAARYPEAMVEDWTVIAPEVSLYTKMLDQTFRLIMFVILLALIFGIINTMLMAVLERVREFGMLKAVGMSRRRIFTMVMLETVFLVMVGLPAGLLAGYGTISYFGAYGIDLSMVAKGLESFGWSNMIYPELTGAYYVETMVEVTLAALVASLFPAYRALKLNPIEALRTV